MRVVGVGVRISTEDFVGGLNWRREEAIDGFL